LDKILGIDNSSLLSPELRGALKAHNISYLYQASAQASLGFIANQWKSSEELELTGNLVDEWFSFCKALILSGIQLQPKEDLLIWSGGDHSGVMTVRNVYNTLAQEYWPNQISGWRRKFWSWDLALKIKLFMWLALENKILSWDNLRKRGWEGPSVCSLCNREEELVFHIFVSCTFTQQIWNSLSTEYNFTTVWGGNSLLLCFGNWQKMEKSLCNLPAVTCWFIWLTRNKCIFESSTTSVQGVLYQIRGLMEGSSARIPLSHFPKRKRKPLDLYCKIFVGSMVLLKIMAL
jgi:hypothetical protein